MEGNKSNEKFENSDNQRGSGEPGFVFTDYDRGARPTEKTDSRDEDASNNDTQKRDN